MALNVRVVSHLPNKALAVVRQPLRFTGPWSIASPSPPRFPELGLHLAGRADADHPDGRGVRLTDSGLGCANWPKCGGTQLPPLSSHALTEFGNRAVSGVVGVITVITALLAFTRRPFRRGLALLALTLPRQGQLRAGRLQLPPRRAASRDPARSAHHLDEWAALGYAAGTE